MAIENGDFVRVNFTGKTKETDEVFDTTYDEIALEADIFDENKTYKPIPIVVGGNHLLPAIEEEIVGLEAGDRKTVEVASDDAFGPRDPKAIQLIPVKVDFNHPLAGKDLVYDIEVTEIIEDDEEKIKSMIELHYANPNVDIDKTEISIEDGVVNIQMDEMSKFDQQSYMDVTFARFRISKDVWENIEGVTKVNFVDAFEKREEKEEDEEVAEEVSEATEE